MDTKFNFRDKLKKIVYSMDPFRVNKEEKKFIFFLTTYSRI